MDKQIIAQTNFSVMNNDTGEMIPIDVSIPETEKKRFVAPKRLNMRVWIEALNWAKQKSCKSMLDVKIFDYITDGSDRYNEFREEQKTIAELLGTTPNTINRQIKRMVDIRLLHRKERGVYMINPFVLASRKIRDNETMVSNQAYWTSIYGSTPTTASINDTGML